MFKHGFASFTRSRFQTDFTEEFLFREFQAAPLLLGCGWQVGHTIVKTGNGDLAALVVNKRNHPRQSPDRVHRRSTIETGVKIEGRAFHCDLLMHHAAQARGNGGGFRVPHVGVANEGHIAFEFSRIGFEKWHQRR